MACSTHKTSLPAKQKRWPLLSALVLIILPKCPYCLIAYSSAITICGLPAESTHGWEPYLIGILVIIILLSLFISYRGRRTWMAIAVAAAGIIGIVAGLQGNGSTLYHMGCVLMLLSTLINRKIFKFSFQRTQLKQLKQLWQFKRL